MESEILRPTLTPIRSFMDTRGYSFFNIFPKIQVGQINISTVFPNVVKGLHYHKQQEDYWFCISGNIHIICVTPKVNMFDFTSNQLNDYSVDHFFIGENNPALVTIPIGTSHGYTNVGLRESKLIYYVTKEYDLNSPDEFRVPYDFIGKQIWETENK